MAVRVHRRLLAAAAALTVAAVAVFPGYAAAQQPPGAPTISALAPGEKSFTVAWTAPAGIADGVTVKYEVRWIDSAATDKTDAFWTMVEASRPQTGWEIVRGLDNGTSYDVQVRAVEVRPASTDREGSWSLVSQVTPTDAPAAFRAGIESSVALGTPVGAELDDASDIDFFKLVLGAETTVLLRTAQTAAVADQFSGDSIHIGHDDAAPPFDTYCILRDAQGNEIASNEHGYLYHGTENCALVRKLAAGTYYVTVRGYREAEETTSAHTGPYVLYAQEAGDPGNTTARAVRVAAGEVAGGRIETVGDVDVMRLSGGAEDRWVRAFVPFGADLSVKLLDAGGRELSGSTKYKYCRSSSCEDAGRQVGFVLPKGADRFVKIESSGGRLGGYLFSYLVDDRYRNLFNGCQRLSRPAGWDDPLSGCQWHLRNVGQLGGLSGKDANVAAAHAAGYLGEDKDTGVRVAVAVNDTGVDVHHEDLADNASEADAYSGCPEGGLYSHGHGTATAGVVAARDNAIGMRGVAPRAKVYSRWILRCPGGGNATVSQTAEAMARDIADIAVSVNSWNHAQDWHARTVEDAWDTAVGTGLKEGFGGKGTTYVIAAGNGEDEDALASLSEYNTHHGMIVVCASDNRGKVTPHSSLGVTLWVCGPSQKNGGDDTGIATLAPGNSYRTDYGGTSASTPIVGGVAALVRAAEPDLTWRDVKLILAGSADVSRVISGEDTRVEDKIVKGARKYRDQTDHYYFSESMGFGVVDALAALELADGWKLLPKMLVATEKRSQSGVNGTIIPDPQYPERGKPGTLIETTVTFDDTIEFIEHVQVDVHFNVDRFRDLEVILVSPSGTTSALSRQTRFTYFQQGFREILDGIPALTVPFRFASSKHLGESAKGTWTLQVRDHYADLAGREATNRHLKNWSMTIRGHRLQPSAPTSVAVSSTGASYEVSWSPPQHEGASEVTGYELSYIDFGSAAPRPTKVTVPGGGTASSYTVTTAGAGWLQAQVRAVNADGDGPWSDEVRGSIGATNHQPSFADRSVRREVAENSAKGTDVGTAVTATDNDAGAELTYSLGGNDASHFDIDSSTGQLSTKSVLDREAKATYSVVVSVSDGLNDFGNADTAADDSIRVTLDVADVDEPFTLACTAQTPAVLSPGTQSTPFSYHWELPEPSPGADESSRLIGRCTVDDPEKGTSKWTLKGDDANEFEMDDSGETREIRFKTLPDYESPADDGGNNIYSFIVDVRIDGNDPIAPNITIKVTDVDEPGAVELSGLGLIVGGSVSATLSDGDGPSGIQWQWQRNRIDIPDADKPTYTAVDTDVGKTLRAVVTYTDGAFGSKKLASKETDRVKSSNIAPQFASADIRCKEDENRLARQIPSCGLTATDYDGDRLRYSIESLDPVPFSTNNSGKISTDFSDIRTPESLDYESSDTWVFDLVVSDGQEVATVQVTVTVNDLDETESVEYTGRLRVGETLNASLVGGDCAAGDCTDTQWQWQYSADGRTWTNIAGAQSPDLLLSDETACRYLRVEARYRDAHDGPHEESTAFLLVGGNNDWVRPASVPCNPPQQRRGTNVQPPNVNVPPSVNVGGGPLVGGGPGGGNSGGGGNNGGGSQDEAAGEATRLWGRDRYATSLAVAREVAELADGRLETVVLAGGHSWADALVAAPLAGKLNAAVLLSPPEGLGADAAAWLREVGVREIIAVGNAEHISEEALAALADIDDDIERIAAGDRYATAAAVARRIGQPATLGPLLGRTVIVASGRVFADALASGPLAASGPYPILLTDRDGLHPAAAAYLAAHADHVIVMGGTAAVTDAVEKQIRAIPQANRSGTRPMAVTRLGGTDRYGTAVAFARWLTSSSALEGRVCFVNDTVGLATGTNAADAAASAPLLARSCAPLVLTPSDRLHPVTASHLRRAAELLVFGGTAAISDKAIDDWNP